MTRHLIAGVDVGKSRCRVVIARHDGGIIARADGSGAAGLPDPVGGSGAALIVADLAERALRDAAAGAAELAVISVGAAGALAAAGASVELASELRERLGVVIVVVTSDAVTSHAGALAGQSGVVTAVGTGAETLAVAADGRSHRVDGWGQWLGDDGSGAWIGRAALNAAWRAADFRGPATALTAAAEKPPPRSRPMSSSAPPQETTSRRRSSMPRWRAGQSRPAPRQKRSA